MTSPDAVGRTSEDGVFRRALRYEWVALRSLPGPWLLCGSAVAAQALVDILTERDSRSGLLSVTVIGLVFFATLGAYALAGEYRHRTIDRTVLTLRSHLISLLAKTTLAAVVTVVIAGVMVGVNALIWLR